jgi:hypothetical protein
MNLDSLSRNLVRQGTDLDQVLGQGKKNDYELTKPLNPPSNWTKFKAALSSVPLLGQLGSLQQARAERDSYPVRLGEYQANNRQILAGLTTDMRAKYGDHIANMAMRDLNKTDGAPLTGRAVSSMLQSAEKAQASNRSWNNQHITRFLESGLSGSGRGRGETDMIGICLDRGMKLGGDNPNWQGMVDGKSARFLERLVRENCKAMPEYSQGLLSNEQIAEAAEKALNLYEAQVAELMKVPGMTMDKIGEFLASLPDTTFKHGDAGIAKHLKEMAITDSMNKPMDRKNPESMLCRVAKAATDKAGLPPLSDSVLKSISNNMTEGLGYNIPALQEQLGCAPDAESTVKALLPRLEAQVARAIDEHIQALQLINDSTTIPPGVKAELLAIAANRRIDPVQVQAYLDAGIAMRSVTEGLQQGNPGKAIEGLQQSLTAFEDGMQDMKVHGNEMWESGSLSGGDFTYTMLDQMSRVAVSSYTQEQAEALLALFTGPEGAQLVASLSLSKDTRLSVQSRMVLLALVEAVAVQAGRSSDTARNIAKSLGNSPEITLDQVPPQIARHIVGGETDVDPRGVVRDAPNGKLVSTDFDPRQVIDTQKQEISDWILRDPPSIDQPWISKTMSVDVGRATFYMQGERIGTSGESRGNTLERFRSSFPEGPDGDAMALAVSRCTNQIGINTFFEVNNQSAFPGMVGSFTGGKTTHEAWRNEDGSWSVRSTHTSRPNAFASPDSVGEPMQVDGNGVALYSLTYRIQPPEQSGGQPVISIVDSRVTFDF